MASVVRRKLGLRTIYIHLPSFYASIFVRNVRRRIEAFSVRRRKENAIFVEAGRDELEELSRFLPHSFRNVIWYFSDIFRAHRNNALNASCDQLSFRERGFKTFVRIVRFLTYLRNLVRDLFPCETRKEKGWERTSGSDCSLGANLVWALLPIFGAILAYGKASLLPTERNNVTSKF